MNGKIYIPEPCHEDWNKMSPAEKGRHCGVCSKTVTDFTHMQTNEIVDFLKNSTNEVCGHIKVKDVSPSNSHQKFNFWVNRYVPKLKLGLAAFVTLILFRKNVMAQTAPEVIMNGGLRYEPQVIDKKKLNISVVNQQRVGVGKANITLTFSDGSYLMWETNDAGKISGELELSVANAVVDIKIEAYGFLTKELKNVPVRKKEQSIEIVMEEEILMLGMMVYIPQDTIVTEPTDTVQNIEILQQEEKMVEIEQPQSEFIFCPNPTSGLVNIKTTYTNPYDLVVYNAVGSIVYMTSNLRGNTLLDLSKEASGNYTAVVMILGKAIETHKIILVK